MPKLCLSVPQVLPCLHTFCECCLIAYLPPQSLTLTCPECRQQSILPEKGVSSLLFLRAQTVSKCQKCPVISNCSKFVIFCTCKSVASLVQVQISMNNCAALRNSLPSKFKSIEMLNKRSGLRLQLATNCGLILMGMMRLGIIIHNSHVIIIIIIIMLCREMAIHHDFLLLLL